MKSIVVLASGNGSNFEAIVRTFRRDKTPIEVKHLITDNPKAFVIERAKRLGIPHTILDYRSFDTKQQYNEKLLETLKGMDIDLIVLAGYMRILPPEIVNEFPNRIVNIHPALLPSFRGLHAIERAFDAGVKVTGVTVHIVTEEVDAGPILAQVPVFINPEDTVETLEERIHRVEHLIFPQVIREYLLGKESHLKIKRALLSVFDKKGIVELAQILLEKGYQILATGGTFSHLKENGIDASPVESITGFTELLESRVKTLHPAIFGGVLADRSLSHADQLSRYLVGPIDVIVVNFYPIPSGKGREILKGMDIGGPVLVRAGIKNSDRVFVVTSPDDYQLLIDALTGKTDPDDARMSLASRSFNRLMAYFSRFGKVLQEEEPMEHIVISFRRKEELRYGENPHQRAFLYENETLPGAPSQWHKIWGKDLSYTNYVDLDTAVNLVYEFDSPACVIVKHTLPCGVAIGKNPIDAYKKAFASDPKSAYGGVVAFNKSVDVALAQELNKMFLDIVASPEFTAEALETLKKKKSRRLVLCKEPQICIWRGRWVSGDILVQQMDRVIDLDFKVFAPTGEEELSEEEIRDILFGIHVIRYVKSNATVVVKDRATIGVGGGQPSRVDSVEIALRKAGTRAKDATLVTDGFFPFPDSIELAANHGIRVVVEPGGSIRDAEVISAALKRGIKLVFTGVRHFTH